MTVRKFQGGQKYGARRATDGTRWYDSTAERDYALELSLLERAGQIEQVVAQPRILLVPGIYYRPDFSWLEPTAGRMVWCDVKGVETEGFRLRARLWRWWGPGLLRVVRRQGRRRGWRTTREILPTSLRHRCGACGAVIACDDWEEG